MPASHPRGEIAHFPAFIVNSEQAELGRFPEPVIERSEDRTNYLCHAETSGHVWHHRRMGQSGTQFGFIRWHGSESMSSRLALRTAAGPFRFQEAITVAEARELATALVQAAFEQEVVESNAEWEAA